MWLHVGGPRSCFAAVQYRETLPLSACMKPSSRAHLARKCLLTPSGARRQCQRSMDVRCMAHPKRVARVAKQIEREIGKLLVYDQVVQKAVCPEYRLGMDNAVSAVASVAEVNLTNDLQQAKVYISIYSDKLGKETGFQGLKRLEGYVRMRVASSMQLRTVPEIRFVYDDSFEKVEEVNRLLELEERRRNEIEARLAAGQDTSNLSVDAELEALNIEQVLQKKYKASMAALNEDDAGFEFNDEASDGEEVDLDDDDGFVEEDESEETEEDLEPAVQNDSPSHSRGSLQSKARAQAGGGEDDEAEVDEEEDADDDEEEYDTDDEDFPEERDEQDKDEGWTRFLTMEDVFGPGYDADNDPLEPEPAVASTKGPGGRQPPTREERREVNMKFKRRRGR